MILKEIIEKTAEHFKKKGIETARLDADILISKALAWKRIDIYLNYEKPLTEAEISKCREWVQRRSQGEPVAYITGEKGFFNDTFFVGPGVLIPRPETEMIVELAIEELQSKPEARILDLGSGTGCIPISILRKIPDATAVGVENSANAREYLEKNTSYYELQNRFQIVDKNVETLNVEGLFEVVTANPPYIAFDDEDVSEQVRRYEPKEALFAQKSGLSCIEDWAKVAQQHLKPDGLVLFEIGSTQGPAAKQIFESLGLAAEIRKDLSGLDRIVYARKRQ